MVTTKAGEVERDPTIETMVDYKRGLKNLDTASKVLSSQSGLDKELSAIILKSMKRDNVTQIQGYSNAQKQLKKPNAGNVK